MSMWLWIYVLFIIWAVCITVANVSHSFLLWCSTLDQDLSNKKKVFPTFGEPASQEALILAEKCEPDADKSDEEEKDPTTTEPSDLSDHKPDTTSTLRSPLISWLYKQNMLVIFEYAPEYEHMLLAIFVCNECVYEPEAEKSDEGEKSPEAMEPPDQASDQGCLPEIIPTLRSPPTNPVSDQGCLPEVIPTLRSPPPNPVTESEKTDVKNHQEDFTQSENLPSKNQEKKKIPLKEFKPLPENYIPIYPCMKDLWLDLILTSQKAGKEDKNLSGHEKADTKNEVPESHKKPSIQSGKDSDSPQSGNIPSKDKIIKKKITFKVIHPSPLLQKDLYLTLQVQEGSVVKKKFKIKSLKTGKNQENPPLIFYMDKDDDIVLNVIKKKISFGWKSTVVLKNGKWSKLKNGWYIGVPELFSSIIPGLKIELIVEDILETIEKPDSEQNKTQQKIKPSFLKNEFLHLKERFKKRRSE